MSDNQQEQAEAVQAQEPNAPAGAENTGSDEREQFIPRARFDEVNTRAKEWEKQVKAMQAEQRKAQQERDAAEQKRLEEQNEFKALYEKTKAQLEELLPYRERIEQLETQLQQSNADRIKAIPEKMRSLVPDYDDPFKVQAWLDANAAMLSAPVAPATDAGVQGDAAHAVKLSDAELKVAKALGITPEQYAKNKAQ